MKKKYIIIGILTIIIFTTIIIFITKIKTKEIKQTNQNNEQKQEIIEEKCEMISTPLMTQKKENEHLIYDSKGPITEEKIKTIIDNQLHFLFYKKSYREITNEDLFYRALAALKNKNEFTKEQLNEGLEKTVLKNLKLRHESHYTESGYNYIYEDGIYKLDDSKYKKIDGYNESPIYGEVQSFNENYGIYTINIKYLWIAGNYAPSSILYKNRYDSIKKINRIQIPKNTKCQSKWIKENFNKYKEDLPTYTYSFKEINSDIYLVDYYITDTN